MNLDFKKGPFSLIQHFLPEIGTPAQSLTTVMYHAGDADLPADWVMEDNPPNTRPRSQAA